MAYCSIEHLSRVSLPKFWGLFVSIDVEILWEQCLKRLATELADLPGRPYDTWIRPLHLDVRSDGLFLLAPNQFVLDWVDKKYFERICRFLKKQNLMLTLAFI